MEMAEPYRNVMDFAFFAVNFGYSRRDYDSLTPTEKAFIYRAWEDKTVSESTMLRDAVLNAVSNALRKKNARFRKLWKKVQEPIDKELARENLNTVREIEEKEGKSWVDRILRANGIRRRGGV